MNALPQNVLELPLEERALLALRSAVQNVFDEHARIGLPLHIWSEGKVVEISAKDPRSSRRNRARKAR
jgi:hypothetical protein